MDMSNTNNFHPFEVVGHVSETRLQVGENPDDLGASVSTL